MLVDGTFWRADEMIELGFSTKSAADMGNLPQSGETGMIAVLERIGARRKVLIYINNTNPILGEDSEQRATRSKSRSTAWRSTYERGSTALEPQRVRIAIARAAPATTSIIRSTSK